VGSTGPASAFVGRVTRYQFVWDQRAALELLAARTFLGRDRAAALDDELDVVAERLAEHPYAAPPAFLRGAWSESIRKLGLSKNPYHLYYEVDVAAEEVVVLSIRHESKRPLRRL
jgi:plasmid stabilization system protein ParE